MIEKSSLIDSNIWIYFLDASEGAKHAKALAFVRERLLNNDSCVSVQNLVELYSNITQFIDSPISIEDARTALRQITDSTSVFSYSPETIIDATTIQQKYRIHFWDALLCATMRENGITTIYTEDVKDFAKIPWLNVINPLA